MATILEKKNGGPYSKQEQEKRRNQVYALYFEKGYSAVKIAEKLGVNRNTVNEDIKYWNQQIAVQFGKDNLGETLCRHIERLNIQRKRLIDEIDTLEDVSKKIRLERLLFDIDYKITGFISKVLGSNLQIDKLGSEEIPQDEISGIVRKICLSGFVMYPDSMEERDILRQIISITGCDEDHSRNIFKTLKNMGLAMFTKVTSQANYDLLSFAVAKRILSTKEKEDFVIKRVEDDKKEEQRFEKIERRYIEKYGKDQTKWSKQVVDQMDDEMFGY